MFFKKKPTATPVGACLLRDVGEEITRAGGFDAPLFGVAVVVIIAWGKYADLGEPTEGGPKKRTEGRKKKKRCRWDSGWFVKRQAGRRLQLAAGWNTL